MRLSGATKKEVNEAIRHYGPKHPLLQRLVRFRNLGFALACLMLLIYVVTCVVLVMQPERMSIERMAPAVEHDPLKKLIL